MLDLFMRKTYVSRPIVLVTPQKVRYEYRIEWFENYGHTAGSAQARFYERSWVAESSLPSFSEEYVVEL